ncbi:MAG: neutral/alkaline non-lysosomal ceramidase N-terminal domain-containing protein [Verrucomicrobiales bacterium]|nr:neutral/alkaline non-lysosomal ceramidase N-terminal domain-containing protein [Verrucomicrobiales bacterium]
MKYLVTILVFTLSLTIAKAGLNAGAALSNITPQMGVPLNGVIMQTGPAKDIHDELFARCIVLSDGKVTLAFAIVDSTMISTEVHNAAKRQIESELGIPPGNVCIAATHTHSTPRSVTGLVDDDLHREYLDFLAVRLADGVKRAHNRLTPAEIGWGSFEEPRFVHNRRWYVKNAVQSPFGDRPETVKMNPGANSAQLDKPAGPVDPEVFVVAIRNSENSQPIAVLGNYGLHYVGGIPGGTVSADYFGVFSDAIQQKWNADRLSPPFVGAMSNGTSGDVNAIDFRKPRQKFALYQRMNEVAMELAKGARQVIDKMEFQSDVNLASASRELRLKIRKPSAERLRWARKNKAPDDTKIRLNRTQVYAKEALILNELPDDVPVPLQVFRIGDLAVAQSPSETFAETGLAIKEKSPFAGTTFTIELANGYTGYLPPKNQFEFGGYETWPARSSFLEEEAETKMRATLLQLLKQVKP